MYYILLCRSLTAAQKAAKLLQSDGIFAVVTKAPQDANPGGCTYGVKVAERRLRAAQELLEKNRINVIKTLVYDSAADRRGGA